MSSHYSVSSEDEIDELLPNSSDDWRLRHETQKLNEAENIDVGKRVDQLASELRLLFARISDLDSDMTSCLAPGSLMSPRTSIKTEKGIGTGPVVTDQRSKSYESFLALNERALETLSYLEQYSIKLEEACEYDCAHTQKVQDLLDDFEAELGEELTAEPNQQLTKKFDRDGSLTSTTSYWRKRDTSRRRVDSAVRRQSSISHEEAISTKISSRISTRFGSDMLIRRSTESLDTSSISAWLKSLIMRMVEVPIIYLEARANQVLSQRQKTKLHSRSNHSLSDESGDLGISRASSGYRSGTATSPSSVHPASDPLKKTKTEKTFEGLSSALQLDSSDTNSADFPSSLNTKSRLIRSLSQDSDEFWMRMDDVENHAWHK